MARQGFFQRLVGGAVNAALPGTPYNRYSGYNPTLTRNSLISGAVGQVIPGGGALAQSLLNQSGGAQAATAGQQGISGLMGSYTPGANSGFDSSGIQADFAPIAGVDLPQGWQPDSTGDSNYTAPQQAEPTQLAGLVSNAPTRDSRSGSSAGSHVLAEGQAAQDMVGGWQLANFLKGPQAPQFGQRYTRQA